MESLSQQTEHKPFDFLGQTGEYFKIWIVNILLTIITLGIYSAWAKVRTRRYFYGNTIFQNTAFDYVADPVKIFKGRLIALALLILFAFSSFLGRYTQGIFWLLFVALLPLIVIKALSFNLHNTTYRNIRCNFHGTYLQALWVYIGLPVLLVLTLGLCYPYLIKEQKRFIVDNISYGTTLFKMTAGWNQFYGIFLKASIPLILLILLFAAIFSILPMFNATENNYNNMINFSALLLLFPMAMLVFAYIYTKTTNLVINHTTLAEHTFECTMETGKICWLFFSNTLAIVFSFGLLIPWARIRATHYKISCISLLARDDIENFIAGEDQRVEAIGEEIGDMFDIDIGL